MGRRWIGRGTEPPLWFARLRWRLKGASARLWLLVAVAVDLLLFLLLPVSGDGWPWSTALLIAIALNVALVLAGGAVGSTLLRRRDPSLPRLVARDRAATYALVAGTVAVCTVGIVHRPAVTAERARFDDMLNTARQLAQRRAPAYVKARLGDVDVRRWTGGVYRVCFPLGQPGRAWCAIVRPDGPGFKARSDTDQRSNDRVGGTAGPPPIVRRSP